MTPTSSAPTSSEHTVSNHTVSNHTDGDSGLEAEQIGARVVAAPSPARLRLDEQLCFALYSASNAVIRSYRPLLRALGLTYPQYVVMMALWERDDITMTELSLRLDLPVHGLSPVVERLCTERLIERHPDTHDRRLRRLHLTATGRALEPPAAQAQAQVVEHSRLTSTKLEQLRDELRQLINHLHASETLAAAHRGS